MTTTTITATTSLSSLGHSISLIYSSALTLAAPRERVGGVYGGLEVAQRRTAFHRKHHISPVTPLDCIFHLGTFRGSLEWPRLPVVVPRSLGAAGAERGGRGGRSAHRFHPSAAPPSAPSAVPTRGSPWSVGGADRPSRRPPMASPKPYATPAVAPSSCGRNSAPCRTSKNSFRTPLGSPSEFTQTAIRTVDTLVAGGGGRGLSIHTPTTPLRARLRAPDHILRQPPLRSRQLSKSTRLPPR